jgi:uncharacterized protein with GYD domain
LDRTRDWQGQLISRSLQFIYGIGRKISWKIDWRLLYVWEYDVVLIIEAPNDEAVMSLMLKVGSPGNVKTKTLKAFTNEEGFKIIKNLP